jgi:RimJ/RimL family protein N-acetyltransferase
VNDMSENVEIKEMKEINYDDLSKIVRELYFEPNVEQGEKSYDPEHMKILLGYFFDKNQVITAYQGGEIIGATFGSTQTFFIEDDVAKGCYLDLTVVKVSLQKQGIGTKLIQKMLEKLKNDDYDFAFAFPLKSNKPAQAIAKKLDFAYIGDLEPRVRALDPGKLSKLSVPAALRALAAPVMHLVSRMPKKRIEEGTFREASEEEYPQILDLLHEHKKRYKISRKWDLDEYKAMAEAARPLNFKQYIWEKDGKILICGTSIDEHIYWKNADEHVSYIRHVGWDDKASSEDLKRFFAEMIYDMKDRSIAIRISNPTYLSVGMLSYVNFMGDRHSRKFMIYPFTDKGEKVRNIKYIREHYMNAVF